MAGYIKGQINETLDLGTLAADTLVSDTWDESVLETSIITSIEATWTLNQLTGPQGPILFGVAHSDYTDAEIEQVLENAGSWDQGNKVQQEVAKRLVRVIGSFASTEQASAPQDVNFNDGKPVKTKLNWKLQTGDTLKMWAYNISAASLASTAPIMRANGFAHLFQQ